MGHLLETSNPEAAQEIKDANPAPEPAVQEPVPAGVPVPERPTGLVALPEVGDMVLYHPRGSEVRRGRRVVAALVTWQDTEKRELELCLIHEANDVRQQDKVREWPGGDERGWEAKGGQVTVNRIGVVASGVDVSSALESLAGEILELREIVLGEFEKPDRSITEMLDDVDSRLDALKRQVVVVKGDGAKPRAPVAKKKAGKGK